jgi:hypothetical protein
MPGNDSQSSGDLFMKTVAQVLLILPATLLAPIGWFVFFNGYIPEVNAPASIYFTKAALFLASSLVGLIALWRSVFYTRTKEVMRPSRLLVAGLVVGLLFDTFALLSGISSPPSNPDVPEILFLAWLIGGTFVVGIWNLITIFSPHEPASS